MPAKGPLLRPGDRSEEISDVQARLRALGFTIDDDAGHFGDSTRAAVRAFQQRRQILVDGIVGPHTWRELVEASWRLGNRTLYLRNPPMRGDDVVALQTRLNALGFDAGRADGIFGRDTFEGVRAYQREYGVAEDGIWGPRSQAALDGLRVDRPGTTARLREQRRWEGHRRRGRGLIVVDPGHGGDDAGEATLGLAEATVCWDIATRLADRLTRTGMKVELTRRIDEAPEVEQRARRANDLDADLFVSLHLNTHADPSASGTTTFYFGGSPAGEELADRIQTRLVSLGLADCRVHARAYPLLRETRMPAVIVEPMFLTNPNEAVRLAKDVTREEIAAAIALGIQDFYGDSVEAPRVTSSTSR